MAEQFRIEIPIDVQTNANIGELQQLEQLLGRIYNQYQHTQNASQSAFNTIANGAEHAATAMDQAATATTEAASAIDDARASAQNTSGAYQQTGQAAQTAGRNAANAFTQASTNTDRFTQRVERSNQTLRSMFKEKFQLIVAALDKASPVLKNIGTSLKSMTAKAWNVAVKMKDMITAPFKKLKDLIMNPITISMSVAGISFGAQDFYSTFTEYTSGMSTVKALSGATGEEFEKLKAQAEELGATTKFTAAEAAEGMTYLAMAGWDVSQIMEGMPGLLNLAAAGGTDLGTAADIVSDVMTAMGMSADQAGRAADVFAKTATATNTTIENLGETMKYAAPIAHSFGLELEDVSAVAGMMANAGIKGSQAGTALRASLLRMSSPTSEMEKTMKKLGISFTEDSGKMKSMQDIIRDLSTAFSGLSESASLEYAQVLFGTEAASAWLGIINQGADEYEKLADSIYNASGAAEAMANTQLDNLAGDVTILQSAVDGMKITLMQQLDPYLRKIVQWATGKIPELTEMLSNGLKTVIQKAGEVKDFISGVFNSDAFKNADGIFDKFQIAWNKIIAEPFIDWWEGGGRDKIVGKLAELGKQAGELLHGIAQGIISAFTGSSVDDLHLGGFAEAGATAAKSFVSSFASSLNVGDLFGQLPAALKAGIAGIGLFKVGSAGMGIAKNLATLKMAFGGIATTATAATTAATAATTATAAVGTAAATTATSAVGAGTALAALKAGLAAIPVWGWVAAAAVTAVTVGVIAYSNAQKQHKQDLLNTGKAAAEMADQYEKSVNDVRRATEAVNTAKAIELQIQENKGGNQAVINQFNNEIAEIQDRIVWLTARKAGDSLNKEEILKYQSELEELTGREAEVKAILEKGEVTKENLEAYQLELETLEGQIATVEAELNKENLTEEQIAEYQATLETLKDRKAKVSAWLSRDEVTEADLLTYQKELDTLHARIVTVAAILNDSYVNEAVIADYQAEINALKGNYVEVVAKLEDSGYDKATVAAITAQLDKIQEGEHEVTLILKDKTDLSADDIATYVRRLSYLMALKTEKELKIEGAGMSADEIQTVKDNLAAIESRDAVLTAKIDKGQGTMSDDDWKALCDEAAKLKEDAANLKLIISGYEEGSTNQAQVQAWKDDLATIKGEAEAIMLNVAYDPNSDLKQADLDNLSALFTSMGEVYAYLNVELAEGSLENLEELNTQLNEAYRNIVEMSGGRFTMADVEHGRITQEDYDAWLENYKITAEAERINFEAQVIADRENIDELVQRRDEQRSMVQQLTSENEATSADKAFLSDIETKRKLALARYNRGVIDEDELYDIGVALKQEISDYQWSNGRIPSSLETMQALDMFGTGWGANWKSYKNLDNSPLNDAFADLNGRQSSRDTDIAAYTAEEKGYNDALLQQYANEVRVVETSNFAGFGFDSDFSTATIDELAASYSQLDEAGQTMFANAIAGLAELNNSVSYISDDEKLDIQGLLDQASQSVTTTANVDVIGDVTSRLEELKKVYDGLYTDEAKEDYNAQNLEAVNTALQALGQGTIADLSQIDTALASIAAIDPSGLDFTTVTASAEALGISADNVKTKVETLYTQLQSIERTYTATINIQTNGSVPDGVNLGVGRKNANGGIYDGAMLSWVAEDGPEAIIPLGSKRRDRGLDLWLQAGQMLGVAEYADGGIMAPYGAALDDLPDIVWSDDGGSESRPVAVGVASNGNGGNTYVITVESTPTYEIDGNESPSQILDIIYDKQGEIAEMLGNSIAEKLGDIVSNMA